MDHRIEFSRWWTLEFKAVKFPTTANTTVFDYFIDPETKKFELWSKKVPKFELDPDVPLQAALVPTPETVRIRYWMGKYIDLKSYIFIYLFIRSFNGTRLSSYVSWWCW